MLFVVQSWCGSPHCIPVVLKWTGAEVVSAPCQLPCTSFWLLCFWLWLSFHLCPWLCCGARMNYWQPQVPVRFTGYVVCDMLCVWLWLEGDGNVILTGSWWIQAIILNHGSVQNLKTSSRGSPIWYLLLRLLEEEIKSLIFVSLILFTAVNPSGSPPCHSDFSSEHLCLGLYLMSILVDTQAGCHPFIFSFQKHCSSEKSGCWFLLLYCLECLRDYPATYRLLNQYSCCCLGSCHVCCIWWNSCCIL